MVSLNVLLQRWDKIFFILGTFYHYKYQKKTRKRYYYFYTSFIVNPGRVQSAKPEKDNQFLEN